jgi:hypothetical protein
MILVGYEMCGYYKIIKNKGNGVCESLTVCDWCKNCPYNRNKAIKIF